MTQYKELFSYIRQNEPNLKELSCPLEQNFNVKFLAYRKFFFKENKLLYLVNHSKWLEQIFEHDLWASQYFYRQISAMHPYHINIWPEHPDTKDITFKKLYDLNIWNGIVLYFIQEDCVETFCFTGDRTQNIQNFFINNQHILKNFVHHFKYTGKEIINGIKTSHLIDFDASLLQHPYPDSPKNSTDYSKKTFFPKKYCLHIKGQDLFITEKEKNCLFYLSKGKTYKEAAFLLGVSPRTVEDHINRLKVKLGCSFTCDLIGLYLSQVEFFYGSTKNL